MLTENTRLAYITVGFDLAGNVSSVTRIQRNVLDRDGVPDRELDQMPSDLLYVAAPTEQDVIVAGLAEVQAKLAAL